MIIKYSAYKYSPNPIEEIEVEKETEKSIWINGGRRAKYSDGECFFDTWKEAKDYLLDQAASKLEQSKKEVEKKQSRYAYIKHLKEIV